MQPVQATCGVEKSTSGPMRETAFSPHSDTFTSFLNNCLGTLHSNHFLDNCGGGVEPAYLEHLDSVTRTIKKLQFLDLVQVTGSGCFCLHTPRAITSSMP